MLLYCGTYTDSIFVVSFDPASRGMSVADSCGGLVNPSFLAKGKNHIYAACETLECAAVASLRELGGRLEIEKVVKTEGAGTCHVSLAEGLDVLYAADYVSGGFWSCALDNGALCGNADRKVFCGKGANLSRQEKEHSHSLTASPDCKIAVGADLGLDRLFVFSGNRSGKLDLLFEVPVNAGYGPRHFAFSKDCKCGYLTNELSNRIIAYRVSESQLEAAAEYDIPCGEKTQKTLAAAIAMSHDGEYLYASVRYPNVICCFRACAGGELSFVGSIDSGGKCPRAFCLSSDGRFLFVANQDSSELVAFEIADREKFLAHEVARLQIPSISAVIA